MRVGLSEDTLMDSRVGVGYSRREGRVSLGRVILQIYKKFLTGNLSPPSVWDL